MSHETPQPETPNTNDGFIEKPDGTVVFPDNPEDMKFWGRAPEADVFGSTLPNATDPLDMYPELMKTRDALQVETKE